MAGLPIINQGVRSPDHDFSDPVPLAGRRGIGHPGWLNDRQGRSLRYLRLSVTDRCDLKCQYCMPQEGIPPSAREDVLTFEEIGRVVKVFMELGVKTVRLTGGEPLVRRNLDELVRRIKDLGIDDIAMTTNATALRPLAKRLVDAGLNRVNISLDSVHPETFREMTRGGDLERVMAGIDAIRDAGIGTVKTNSVVVRDHNHTQLGEIVDWAWDRNIVPRFIELMPLGEGAKLGTNAVVPVAEMKTILGDRITQDAAPEHRADRGPAGYVPATRGHGCKVGFIGAVTENFCERCNRIRMTAKGEIRACLASPNGLSLRDLIREGHDDEAILAQIRQALFGKWEGHHFNVDGVTDHEHVNMSALGG